MEPTADGTRRIIAAKERDNRRDRDGRDKARLFRQYRLGPSLRDVRRCDLEQILDDDRLEVCESVVPECGYAACLLRMPEGGGGIMIAAGQESGRRRFSIAHELGHYHIPSHADGGNALQCADSDLRVRSSDARRREWEANDFATELLMPYRLFSGDVVGRDAILETAAVLAAPDMYDVSLTASTWRLVEATREMCAMVVSIDGNVEWVVRSATWDFPLAERRRPLPVGSVSQLVANGEQPNRRGERIDPGLWLSSADGRFRPGDGIRLIESTHSIPRLCQVITLLWAVEG